MSGITILDRTNAPTGPFTRAQIAEKLQRGEITLSSLAFTDGLAQWTPLRDILARLDAANPPPPAIVAPPAPAVAAATPIAAPASPTPAYSYAATMEPPPHLIYAGFWLRVIAHLVDAIVLLVGFGILLALWLGIVALTVGLHGFGSFQPPSSSPQIEPGTLVILALLEILLVAAIFVMGWLYHACLESSAWQGTLGKFVLGLRITGMTGERITFWHATGRFLARIVATLPFFAGYIMCAFTPRKQALHDLIASTLVVRK